MSLSMTVPARMFLFLPSLEASRRLNNLKIKVEDFDLPEFLLGREESSVVTLLDHNKRHLSVLLVAVDLTHCAADPVHLHFQNLRI